MTSLTTHTWRRFTRAKHCVICGGPDWCSYADDGLILCMRSGEVPAGYKFIRQNPSGGSLYAPVDNHQTPPLPPPKRRPTIDWPAVHAKARSEIIPGELYDFAEIELGLVGWSLDLLDVGVIDDRYVFPERDANGKIIGLVRREIDGSKWSLTGSRRGLTYQYPLPDDDPVLIVEGASDTAAAIEAGYTAVGRPSNTGGGDMLAKLLRGRHVVLFGENDQKPDGSWPGRDGVKCIAPELRRVCAAMRTLYPPAGIKDLRAWLRAKP